MITLTNIFLWRVAEFRGPGVHHNFDDSNSDYDADLDNKSKSFGVGGYRGRIIFLGDGTEVLTDSDDTEMFDQEDKDLDSQVSKTSASDDGSSRITDVTDTEDADKSGKADAASEKADTSAKKPEEKTTA